MLQDEDMSRKCGVGSCGRGALLGVRLWLSLCGTLMVAFGLCVSPQLLEASLGASGLICTGQIEWNLEVRGEEKVN